MSDKPDSQRGAREGVGERERRPESSPSLSRTCIWCSYCFSIVGFNPAARGERGSGEARGGPVACVRWSIVDTKGLRSQEVNLGRAGRGGPSAGNQGRPWKESPSLPRRQIARQARASRSREGLGLGSWRTGIVLVTPSQDSPLAEAHPPSRPPRWGTGSLSRGPVP